jgi:hypothetical protein
MVLCVHLQPLARPSITVVSTLTAHRLRSGLRHRSPSLP